MSSFLLMAQLPVTHQTLIQECLQIWIVGIGDVLKAQQKPKKLLPQQAPFKFQSGTRRSQANFILILFRMSQTFRYLCLVCHLPLPWTYWLIAAYRAFLTCPSWLSGFGDSCSLRQHCKISSRGFWSRSPVVLFLMQRPVRFNEHTGHANLQFNIGVGSTATDCLHPQVSLGTKCKRRKKNSGYKGTKEPRASIFGTKWGAEKLLRASRLENKEHDNSQPWGCPNVRQTQTYWFINNKWEFTNKWNYPLVIKHGLVNFSNLRKLWSGA